MSREEARKAAEIMLAYANGKEIEYKNCMGHYQEIRNPDFNWEGATDGYRIKIEPEYRPFINARECLLEMQKHQPYGRVKPIADDIKTGRTHFSDVFSVNEEGVEIDDFDYYLFPEAMDTYTFADGTPFGKQVEEADD